MKTKILFLLALCLVAGRIMAAPLGTAFTYQGYLSDAGTAASGNFDFQFSLFDSANNGNQVGPTLPVPSVSVVSGFFTVTLDFGNVFDGNARWLALGVRTSGSTGAFTALTPLQLLAPTPYALYASGGGATNVAAGSISAAQLNTTGPSAALGQVLAYNGASLVWTNPPSGGGGGNYWSLTGNSGTTSGVDFVGTTDLTAFELHVAGVRALQLAPTFDTPNLVGGAPGNYVASDVQGATIAGGGTIVTYGRPYTNSIYAYHGTIGGGLGNTIGASAIESTIAGGNQNSIQTAAHDSSIGGGYQNWIQSGASDSTVSGGYLNAIQNNASYAAIAGGQNNTIVANAQNSAIGGGYSNSAAGQFSTIAGGASNAVQNGANDSSVGGGNNNMVIGQFSTIAGGSSNSMTANGVVPTLTPDYSFIGGGQQNTIGSLNSAGGETIAGGVGNQALNAYATIGGGSFNQAAAGGSTIAGGSLNVTVAGEGGASIGGGANNTAGSGYATIAGGLSNTIPTPSGLSFFGAAIGGGSQNFVAGNYATVPGGYQNQATGQSSFAAGQIAVAKGNNSFVWGDGTRTAQDQGNNTFNVLATGGVYFFNNGANNNAVYLGAGSTSWNTLSDRNAKKNFKPLDSQAVLEKLASIPVQQWSYKWEKNTDTPNFGPTAQDFKHAFYPGRDDKGITTLEFDGVELAAIQGLNQKLEQRDERLQAALKEKDARIAQLEKELAEVKSTQRQSTEQWDARFESLRKLVARVANEPKEAPAALAGVNHNP